MSAKAQENIPALRFPEFNGEWGDTTLGKVAPSPSYGMNASAVPFDGTHKYLRITDIDEETRAFVPNPLTSPEAPISSDYSMKINDIVFTRTGASTGKTYLYNPKDGKLFFAGFLIRFRINDANSSFIYFQTLRQNYQKWVTVMSMRSGQPGINASEYSSYSFLIPNPDEQKKIATFLSAVDERIEQITRKKQLLEQYKKGMMQKLFSQKIRFKDDSGNTFPDWEEKQLADVFEEVNDKVGQQDLETYSITAGRGFISQKEKFGRDISGQQNEKYTALSNGSFSYNKGNSKTYKYGCVYLNETRKLIAVPNVFISFKLINDAMSNVFFAKLFEYHYLDKGLRQIISSSARMDGLLNVNKTYFFKLKILVPPTQEQQKIADFLSSLDDKIDLITTELSYAQTFKKGLLQQMFV
jgi:type I restriction enzyme, S subunit